MTRTWSLPVAVRPSSRHESLLLDCMRSSVAKQNDEVFRDELEAVMLQVFSFHFLG